MKKPHLLIGLGSCVVLLLVCCGGLGFWGYSLNTQEAKREYDAAEQLWSSGNKAEAVEKYRNIKQRWLGDAEKEVVAQRIREFDVGQTKQELEVAHREWAAGKKAEAVARYKALQLDLLDQAEQDTVNQRVKEFDLAKGKKDLAEANRLWASGDKAKAVALYHDLPLSLLDRADQELVTRRLYETANQQWDNGHKSAAAAAYKRLQQDVLTQAEQETIAQRIAESDETEKQFASAKKGRHGKKVNLKAIELHYTPAVTVAEARKLGEFLDKTFTDADRRSTAQFTKEGKTYQYRVVVKKGIDRDEEAVGMFKALALRISLFVFGGADVEVHLCDDRLKTLRVVIPLGKS